jgi:hypothetical protein
MVAFRKAATVLVALTLALTLAGCGDDAPSPSSADDPATSAPSSNGVGNTTAADLSAIACGTDDPSGVGELTGAWDGSEGGVYYIRQIGECVWWFGTEIDEIVPGLTGQPGFANVASGRLEGTRLDVEFVDVPVGDVLGGGGLTFVYSAENDQLMLVEQRGDWIPFGATVLNRIVAPPEDERSPSPSPSPSESASP